MYIQRRGYTMRIQGTRTRTAAQRRKNEAHGASRGFVEHKR